MTPAGKLMFNRIKSNELTPRQKKTWKFHKLASRLADYGFNCLWLNDGWQGADFIACHIDSSFIKVRLGTRLHIERRYNGIELYIAFNENKRWYIYPHDQLRDELLEMGYMSGTLSWDERGIYNWPSLTQRLAEHMEKYVI